MRLFKALNVSLDLDGTLAKGTPSASTWDCVAILDVPDTSRFEVTITATKDDAYPNKAGSCALGIVEAKPPPASVEAATLRQWCQQHSAFVVGSGNFRLYQASKDWRHFGIKGTLLQGHELSMRFACGVLEFRLDRQEWCTARTDLDEGHGHATGFRPCVLVYSHQWPVTLRLGRKRGRDTAAQRDARLWQERKFTDATVVCEGERFEVHRAVLCAASQVFERAFLGGLCEARSAVLEIGASAPAAVEAMLCYIYTGSVPDGASEALAPLLELAVQYELRELSEEAAQEVLRGIERCNVRERASVLKRHCEHPTVRASYEKLLTLLQEDRALLAEVL